MASLGETASQCQGFRWPPWVKQPSGTLTWENIQEFLGPGCTEQTVWCVLGLIPLFRFAISWCTGAPKQKLKAAGLITHTGQHVAGMVTRQARVKSRVFLKTEPRLKAAVGTMNSRYNHDDVTRSVHDVTRWRESREVGALVDMLPGWSEGCHGERCAAVVTRLRVARWRAARLPATQRISV